MTPEYVTIPPAEQGDFNIFHVSDSQYWLYLDSERGSRPIFEPVSEFARAIVEDFTNAQLERSTESNAGPGIFWVYGKLSKDQIKVQHKTELVDAIQRQTRWFERLVRKADDDWSKTHQHNHISDLQRVAAQRLNLQKEWLYQDLQMGNERCPACTMVLPNPTPVLCPNCKCILDKDKASKLEFAKG